MVPTKLNGCAVGRMHSVILDLNVILVVRLQIIQLAFTKTSTNMFIKCFFVVASVLVTSSVAADEPLWYSRIEAEDTTGILKRCEKRKATPVNGSTCGRRPKLCYFDTLDCDGVGAHPATKCFCDGKKGTRTWKCETESCPVYPDPTKTGCGPVVNDPSCPVSAPGAGTCSGADNTEECNYGQSTWYVI